MKDFNAKLKIQVFSSAAKFFKGAEAKQGTVNPQNRLCHYLFNLRLNGFPWAGSRRIGGQMASVA